jgi:hypothetical protein
VIVIKGDKNLFWDVFDIQKTRWFVKKGSPQGIEVSYSFFLKKLDSRDKIRYDTNHLMIHKPDQLLGSDEGA